jgi:predicted dehydrogenase
MSGGPSLRVGVIGCGWYAQNHLHAWKALVAEGVELVGVADIQEARAEKAGAEFEVPAYTGIDTLVERHRPDIVDIVTTVESHHELIAAAASLGVGVIVQKPLARDWEECLAVAAEVRRSGIFFAVHENFRFQAAILRLSKMVRNGVVGTPSFARISFRTAFDTTAAQPYLLTQKRFILMDIGVHVLDVARQLMGEVTRLTCETQRRRPKLSGEDTATILLRHASGAVSIVDCSFAAQRIRDAFPETMIEIEGDLGCIELAASGRIEAQSRGLRWQENASAPLLAWTERPLHVAQESVLTFNRHALRRWQAGELPDTDLTDSLRTFALVDAAYRSAEAGAAVAPYAAEQVEEDTLQSRAYDAGEGTGRC